MVLRFSAAAPWGVNGFTLWAFFFFFWGWNLQVIAYKLRIRNWVYLFLGTFIRVGFRSYLKSNSLTSSLKWRWCSLKATSLDGKVGPKVISTAGLTDRGSISAVSQAPGFWGCTWGQNRKRAKLRFESQGMGTTSGFCGRKLPVVFWVTIALCQLASLFAKAKQTFPSVALWGEQVLTTWVSRVRSVGEECSSSWNMWKTPHSSPSAFPSSFPRALGSLLFTHLPFAGLEMDFWP